MENHQDTQQDDFLRCSTPLTDQQVTLPFDLNISSTSSAGTGSSRTPLNSIESSFNVPIGVTSTNRQEHPYFLPRAITGNSDESIDDNDENSPVESDSITKALIEKLYQEKRWARLALQDKAGKHFSQHWDRYFQVILDGKPTQFAMCRTCSTVYDTKSGTVSLGRHINKCSRRNGPPMPATTPLTAEEKDEVKRVCLLVCANELRPFQMFDGVAFRKLCQYLVNIGAKHGPVDVSQVLPTGRTISRHCDKVYSTVKKNIQVELSKTDHISVCTDHWSDIKQRTFIGLTVQYSIGRELRNRVLAVQASTGKTCEQTAVDSKQILNSFGVPHSKVSCFVTDNALNSAYNSAALPKRGRTERTWIPEGQLWKACSSHDLNLVHVHTFDKSIDPLLHHIQYQLALCKKLVQFARQSGISQEMKPQLVQQCDTRWDTRFQMVESILRNKTTILESTRPDLVKIAQELDFDLLEKLSDFLKDCYELRMFISHQTKPTISRVWPAKVALRCVAEKRLCDELTALGPHFSNSLEAKFKVDTFHKTATFLSPNYKDNPLLFPEESDYEEVTTQIVEIYDDLRQQGFLFSAHEPLESPSQSSKRPRSIVQFIDSCGPGNLQYASTIEEEVAKYRRLFMDNQAAQLPVMEFWHQNASTLPKLCAIAKFVLTVPATNNATERIFNLSALTMSKTRASLNLKRFNQLLVIKSNYDLASELCSLSSGLDNDTGHSTIDEEDSSSPIIYF